jgi:hypothetical protein
MGAESQQERERYFREQEKKRNKEAWNRHYKNMSEMDRKQYTENPPPPGGTSSCFVATVAFGDPDCWEINTLRNFRDTTLSKNWLGQKFIKWYYKNGEQLAQWVNTKPRIKSATKRILTVIVRYLK